MSQQQAPAQDQLYTSLNPAPAPNAQTAAPVPQQQQPPPQQPMQQPYPAQQVQHQVIVQSVPANSYGACGRTYENYKSGQSLGLGITQILIGVLCIVFNIVGIILAAKDDEYYYYEFVFYTGYGIWNAFFFILAGSFGIGAKSKNPCPVIAFMVLSIIAAVMTMFVLGFAAGGIGEVSDQNGRCDYYYGCSDYYAGLRWYNGHHGNKDGKLAMHALMLILALIELVVAIWSSAICCAAACCCRERGGVVHASPAPAVQYGNAGYGGQVIIHTQGQQPFVVGQPQGGAAYPGGSGVNQPQPASAPVPPAYSASGAPPAYTQPQEKNSGMPPAAF